MEREDRVALVTGAASGLGLAIMKTLLSNGYRVLGLDRSEAVTEICNEQRAVGFHATPLIADVTDFDSLTRTARRAVEEAGRCDVLVNNAGTQFKSADGGKIELEAIELEQWERSIAMHMTAPLLLSQIVLPGMKERKWGRIINVSSRAARTYLPKAGAFYAASKAGLIGLTRSIAGEYGEFGITCNALAPGRFATPLSSRYSEEIRQQQLTEILLRREGAPEEIGGIVSFLCSDSAAFMTGAVLDVNGGSFMAP